MSINRLFLIQPQKNRKPEIDLRKLPCPYSPAGLERRAVFFCVTSGNACSGVSPS